MIRWDLSDLYADEHSLHGELASAEAEAEAFAEAYRGRMAQASAEDMAQALRAFELIQDRAGRAYTFAFLHWSTATQDAPRGALLQSVREACTRISQLLLFFELEWTQLDHEKAERLLASASLGPFRHYLERQRLLKDYMLSEPEEKILTQTAVNGPNAWQRFFTETLGAMRFSLDGEELTQQIILSKLYESDRSLRQRAAQSFTDGLKAKAHAFTFIFNTLLADKASRDRMRGFPHWIKSRHLSNEISDEVAEALIEAVTSRSDLVARFYTLKKRLLGLDELHDYDRYAPVEAADTQYSWREAREVVLDAYKRFHPRMGEIATIFFERRWIDAPVVPGKRGGAFSHGAVPSAHPYVLLNYTGKARDVQTLAHELACIFHHGGEFFDFSGSGSLTGDCVAKIPTLAPSDSMSAEVGAVLVALRGAWRLILPSVGAARAFVSHRHMMASVIQSNTAACLASMQAWDKPRVREALA